MPTYTAEEEDAAREAMAEDAESPDLGDIDAMQEHMSSDAGSNVDNAEQEEDDHELPPLPEIDINEDGSVPSATLIKVLEHVAARMDHQDRQIANLKQSLRDEHFLAESMKNQIQGILASISKDAKEPRNDDPSDDHSSDPDTEAA